MKLDFSVDYMKILESDNDTTLVELDLLHTGKNRNQYVINRDVVEKAIPTIYNKPIIYRLNNEFIPSLATDVLEHGTVEDRAMRIAGTIPESAPMEFVERDGKEYLRTKGVIYKIYQPSLMNILKNRDGNMKISIEIYVTDKEEDEDGAWIVKDFKFEGVALLGADVLEGIEGSQLNVVKFSAKDFNQHYLGFSTKEIPQSVKDCVNNALKIRETRGKGGSGSAVSIAKYLAGNDYIDYARLNCIKEYFNKNTNSNSLSFSLYGGEASKEWLAEISEGKRVSYSMKNVSTDYVYEKIRNILRDLETEDTMWRYYISSLYVEPKEVVIVDDLENKTYLVKYSITEENEIILSWDTKTEIVRCYLPVDEIKEDTLLFKSKEILSIDENGQLQSNTHRLSSVDSAVARKAEVLLNSLEKEDTEMDKEKDLEKEDKKVDNSCEEEEVVKNADTEADRVEDEEKKEDRREDDKEEDDEDEMDDDFAARCNALMAENKELKACLESYQKKEELEKMNALIEEFSYCFKDAEEKAELVKDLGTKTFAEVENIVNEKIKVFAKENKPKEKEEETSNFSIGLLAKTFSYNKKEDKAGNIKDIKNKYSNKK